MNIDAQNIFVYSKEELFPFAYVLYTFLVRDVRVSINFLMSFIYICRYALFFFMYF